MKNGFILLLLISFLACKKSEAIIIDCSEDIESELEYDINQGMPWLLTPGHISPDSDSINHLVIHLEIEDVISDVNIEIIPFEVLSLELKVYKNNGELLYESDTYKELEVPTSNTAALYLWDGKLNGNTYDGRFLYDINLMLNDNQMLSLTDAKMQSFSCETLLACQEEENSCILGDCRFMSSLFQYGGFGGHPISPLDCE